MPNEPRHDPPLEDVLNPPGSNSEDGDDEDEDEDKEAEDEDEEEDEDEDEVRGSESF